MGYCKPPAAQGPHEDIVEYIGPEIPNMGIIVYCRPAAVKAGLPRDEGFKGL
jgi:hypothetical protein